jgi:hypothetical protein
MDFVSIALLLVAAVAQLAPFYWNLTVALKEQHSYRNRLQFFIAGAVGVFMSHHYWSTGKRSKVAD